MQRIPVILLALLLDRAFGDPPNRWHPVAWMGSAIARARRRAPNPATSPLRQLLYGGGLLLVGIASVAGLGGFSLRLARRLPPPFALLLEAALLKTTFSLRGLEEAATQVGEALEAGDLPAARHWLSWHLVSRDTSALSASQVAAGAIESVAENASDGVIAPIFFYALGGLPAALAYRFLNTADAMLGYRDAAREWLGKLPARLDDLANFIPARLTAIVLILGAGVARLDAPGAFHIWRQDARKTASPNAGHPMSAMAGALGVSLEKEGRYRLGEELPPPQPADIAPALHLTRVAIAVAVGALTLSLFFSRMRGERRDEVDEVIE